MNIDEQTQKQKQKMPVDKKTCQSAITFALETGWLNEAVAVACYSHFHNDKGGVSVSDIAATFIECGYAVPQKQILEALDKLQTRGLINSKLVDLD